MAAQVTNYQCPACMATLQFSGSSGMLECEFCDSKFTVEEIETLYKDQDEQAAENFSQETALWEASGLSWDENADGVKAYSCPSCGAQLICDDTTAATACPYCGNNTIVPGQLAGALKPDVVLPFQLDKAAAIQALKAHYKGKWLLPKAFTEENHLKEIQGVYVPFWLYDAQVEVDARFQGINTIVTRSKDYETTHRDHFAVRRRGTVDFTGVPVDGSVKMDNSYMDSLEPFDYTQLKPFSSAYLPGYLADRYDEGAETCAKRADARCEESAVAAMRDTVLGYQEVHPHGHSANIRRGTVRYALLPVWVLYTKWQEKDYLFMMNGQSGKFVGDLPVDKKKARLTLAVLTAVLAVLLQVTGAGLSIGAFLADWVG